MVVIMLTHIKFFVIGNVPKQFIDKVLDIIKSFVGVANNVSYIEVYFYSSTREKIMFLEAEASELGVMVVGDFVAMHDAWRGWPRIHIDYERCSILSEEQLEAVIIHEVSHAVLHGSIQYYVLRFSIDRFKQLDVDRILKLIYIASTVVKDIEVHEMLVRLNMLKTVHNYMDFMANQYNDIKCDNAEELLLLAKAVLPCLYVEPCSIMKHLGEECKKVSEKMLDILKMFKDIKVNELSEDTQLLVEQILYHFGSSI